MSRLSILALVALGGVTFFSLVFFLARDRESSQDRKLAKNLERIGVKPEPPAVAIPTNVPQAVTPQTSHEFGFLSGNDELKHSFIIRNEGTGTLTLTVDKPSCTCIVAAAAKNKLEPGEETTLELQFKPGGKAGRILQGVNVITNDPRRKQIAFQMIGQTRQVFWWDQDKVAFVDMQPEEERLVTREVYSIHESFEIEEMKLDPAEVRYAIEPMPAELLEQENRESKRTGPDLARSGKLLHFTCPGDFKCDEPGYISFNLRGPQDDSPERVVYELYGNRLGKMSFIGPGIDELGKIKMGQLLEGAGKKMVWIVKLRGKIRTLDLNDVTIKTTPAVVKAEIVATPDSEKSGLYQFVVEVPPTAPEQSFLGKNAGEISIDFGQQEYKSIQFKLNFSVVNLKNTK